MKREQAVIMFSALVMVSVVLCGAVFALSAKYNDLAAEHTKLHSAFERCVAGTP